MKIKVTWLMWALCATPAVAGSHPQRPVPRIEPVVLRVLPHDPHAFTQGLLYYKGFLYESTGLYGQSSLRKIDPADGRVLSNVPVPDIFGEGLALMDSELVQLSWKEKAAIIYSLKDLGMKGAFSYEGEGWGLTSDSSSFFMSNGSDTLYIRSKKFALRKKVAVTLNGKPLDKLNELEYVRGKVYANIWYRDEIVEIAPASGKVTRIIDCSAVVRRAQPQDPGEVLNGIAWDPKSRTFYITGKDWRYLFEVKW